MGKFQVRVPNVKKHTIFNVIGHIRNKHLVGIHMTYMYYDRVSIWMVEKDFIYFYSLECHCYYCGGNIINKE